MREPEAELRGPWIMTQCWRDLLFAHWPVDPSRIAPLLPARLQPDLFEGAAFVGLVPFRMTGIRARFLPSLPRLNAFPELNLRTYVRPSDGPPGVYFWSLEASNAIAVATARALFHLPYMNATMSCVEQEHWIDYASHRTHLNEPAAGFRARYRPTTLTAKDSLTDFLTERYRLYAADSSGRLYTSQIHHQPWPLYGAEALIEEESVSTAAGLRLVGPPPLLHFARELQVTIWPPRRVAESGPFTSSAD